MTPAVPARYRLAGHAAALTMPNHGILPLGRWEPVGVPTTQGDAVEAEFRFTCDDGVLARHYPFSVELRHRFALRRRALDLEATFVNRGAGPAPVAFGWHP